MTCSNCKCASCRSFRERKQKDVPRQLSNAVWLLLLAGASRSEVARVFGVSQVGITRRETTAQKSIYEQYLDAIKVAHSDTCPPWLRRLIDAGAVRLRINSKDTAGWWYERRHVAIPKTEEMHRNDQLFETHWSETREQARERVTQSLQLQREEQSQRQLDDISTFVTWLNDWGRVWHQIGAEAQKSLLWPDVYPPPREGERIAIHSRRRIRRANRAP